MLSRQHRDLLGRTVMDAVNLTNWQILVNSVKPGSWNTIVPIHGVSYAAAMALIIDAADEQRWLRDLVQRLADEYPSRPEFVAVLTEIERSATDVAPALTGARRRLAIGAAALSAIVLAIAVGAYIWKKHAGFLGEHGRPSIAVLEFRNQGGKQDTAWLSIALPELYKRELAAGKTLRVIPSENIAGMNLDLQFGDTDSLAPDALQKIRTSLGADLVLIGTYLAVTGNIRVSVQLQDTQAGVTLLSVVDNGTEGDLAKLISRTGARLRAQIGAAQITIPPAQIAGALPSNKESAQLYATGLKRLRTFEALSARDLLQDAVDMDPDHALAHSALASAWAALGYDGKARGEAKRAYELSKKLPLEERFLVKARYHEAAKEWDKAIDFYQMLQTSAPDDVEYGLALARVKVIRGFPRDVFGIVNGLRKLSRPTRDDPRIDLAEGSAAYALGDFQRARDAAGRASAKARDAGARLLLARALLQEAQANLQLSEFQQAADAANEAKQIYTLTRNRGGVADAIANLAIGLYYQGDFSGAKGLYNRSLAIKQNIGDTGGVARLLNNIAAVDRENGDLKSAKALFEQSLALHRDIDDPSGVSSVLNNIAAMILAEGDLESAKATYQESLNAAVAIGDKSAEAWASFNIAALAEEEGNLTEALKLLETALSLQRGIGDKSAIANSLISIAGIYRQQGDLATARLKLNEALEAYKSVKGTDGIFEVRLALADVARDGRRGVASEALARECSDHFQKAQSADREAEARSLLAGVLLEQKKLSKALHEIALAERLATESQDAYIRMSVGVTAARIHAASGQIADITGAHKSLEDYLDMATARRWVARQLEIRLALGEVELKMDKAAGRSRLEQLERDASAKGFNLVARRASEMRRAAT